MSEQRENVFIHPTAEVHATATLGAGSKVWRLAQVRERAKLGKNCILGMASHVDFEVTLGDNCKIQNYAVVYHGVSVGNDVFIGPHACFTNDMYPRATDGRGNPVKDFAVVKTFVEDGASIGANSTIVCGITVGTYSLVAAGSVVTRNVPPHAIVLGNPARVRGYICRCGKQRARVLEDIKCECMEG